MFAARFSARAIFSIACTTAWAVRSASGASRIIRLAYKTPGRIPANVFPCACNKARIRSIRFATCTIFCALQKSVNCESVAEIQNITVSFPFCHSNPHGQGFHITRRKRKGYTYARAYFSLAGYTKKTDSKKPTRLFAIPINQNKRSWLKRILRNSNGIRRK